MLASRDHICAKKAIIYDHLNIYYVHIRVVYVTSLKLHINAGTVKCTANNGFSVSGRIQKK